MRELLLIAIGSALVNNVVLSQFLGICAFLGVSKKIDTADAAFLVAVRGLPASPNPDNSNMDMATDSMPSECGSFGRGDFRPATVVVRRKDGAANAEPNG